MNRLHSPVNKTKKKESSLYVSAMSSVILVMCCLMCFVSVSWAWFTSTASVTTEQIVSATYTVDYLVYEKGDETKVVTPDESGGYTLDPSKIYTVKLTPSGNASTGYVKFTADGEDYTTIQLAPTDDPITFELSGYEALTAEYSWGIAQASGEETPVDDEEEIYKDIAITYYSFGDDSSKKPTGKASVIAATETEKANKVFTSLPTAPEYTGYTFDKWTLSDGTEFDPEKDTFYQDTELYATYTVNKYGYSFVISDTETVSGEADYDSDISALVPKAPTPPEGKTFEGWSKTKGGTTPVEDFGKISTESGNNTFYAIFKDIIPTTAGVAFYEYDGSNEHGPATGTVKEVIITEECAKQYGEVSEPEIGSALVLPEKAPELANYTFGGWFDAEGKEWTAEDTVPDGGLELYAKYIRVQCGLIAKGEGTEEKATTVIERGDTEHLNNLDDVASYTEESVWFVYGLKDRLSEEKMLSDYVDVVGDCSITVVHSHKTMVGTGSTITVTDNVSGEIVEKFVIIIFGDVDGNGSITANDVMVCDKEQLNLTSWSRDGSEEYNPILYKAANLDGKRFVRANDVSIIEGKSLNTNEIDQVNGCKAK